MSGVFSESRTVIMSHKKAKRSGAERRLLAGQAHVRFGERRSAERRQVTITDISFAEWVTHFAFFKQKRAKAAKARQELADAAAREEASGKDQGRQE